MNYYSLIILSAILFEYATNIIANFLNFRTLNSKIPKEFENVFDDVSYEKSQLYSKAKLKFDIVESTFGLLVLIIFWFTGGFSYLDDMVRSLGCGYIFTGVIYIGILLLARAILSLPFRIYSIFVIEEKFGFNKTTPKIFVTDIIKGTFLSVLLGGPLLILVIALFENVGPTAWLYCWIASFIFIIFIQFIAPTWIMPLFNKFNPLPNSDLKKSIFAYASSVNFSLRDVYVMDGSKRSNKSNAFFTGFGKNKRIVLFDTLIQKHNVQELVAVLAHEIGHFKKKHILSGLIISILHLGLMFYILSFFLSEEKLFDAFYTKNVSVYAGLIFFGLLFTPIEFILSLFMNAISRRNEYEADRFAVETIGCSQPMIDALKKISLNNLTDLTPHPFYVFLNYSHPPILHRIQAISRFHK